LYDFEPPARPEGETATRARQAENYDVMLAFIRRGVVIQAARLAPLAEFDSYEAAVAVRDAVADALDDEMEVVGDAGFTALQQLRADLVRAVPGDESDLAHLVKYTPPASVPSLVLAHRLYGALEREQDLIDRNHVQNPAFVLGGQELEVLSGG
jgi:prophage DNA circulation protein